MYDNSFLNLGEGLHEIFHNPDAKRMDILHQLFVTANGRLNRKSWICRVLLLSFTFTVVNFLLKAMAAITIGFPFYILIFLICVINTVCCVTLAIRRLHDLDHCGFWALLLFIPLVNFIVSLYLLLARGTVGPNPYGEDPLQK